MSGLQSISQLPIRASGFHREISGPGTQAQGQPDPIPRCLCSEQLAPGVGGPGQAGQEQPKIGSGSG